jgi:hypothetical protein
MQKLGTKPVKPKKVVREAKRINLPAENEINNCVASWKRIPN